MNLSDLMEDASKWALCVDRLPTKDGTYTVIRKRRSGYYEYAVYLWRGTWLDLAAKPATGVEAWMLPE